MNTRRDAIRSWVAGQRAAQARAAPIRQVPSADDCWRRAIELWDLAPDLFDDPRVVRMRQREVAAARQAWQRLREHWNEQRQTEA